MARNEDDIILVDRMDRVKGYAPKLTAHQRGLRHRAISICIVNRDGRMLLQKRAPEKYHSAGLWSNACCTHPRPAETVMEAAGRRLREELGVVCALTPSARTAYRAPVGEGLIENEFVHLLTGIYDGAVNPDRKEVSDVAWCSQDEIVSGLASEPHRYSYWFGHYVRTFGRSLFDAASGSQ